MVIFTRGELTVLQEAFDMQKYARILSAIKEGTPLLDMIRSGFKPEDIKKASVVSMAVENATVLAVKVQHPLGSDLHL
jgi:hypothetical protein